MELYVFTPDIEFEGNIDNYTSLRWIRRYSETGEFELHCSFNIETLKKLKKGNILWKNDGYEAGVILNRKLSHDSTGKETIVVRGKFLTSLLGRRIIWGTENYNTTVELVIRNMITRNAIEPTDSKRKLGNLTLGNLKEFKEKLRVQSSYRNLLETVESIASKHEYGIRTILDLKNKQMVFDLYKGLDRTARNKKNPPAIFSEEFDNILEQEYEDGLSEYSSVALVAGEGESVDRKIEVVGDSTGLKRFEMYVDASDLQSTKNEDENEITIPENEYRDLLTERGVARLSEAKKTEVFNSKIDLQSNLKYKEDFDLGDVVTNTSKRWNKTIDTRIMEIEEIYEANNHSVIVVFGNDSPSLIEKIKKEVN